MIIVLIFALVSAISGTAFNEISALKELIELYEQKIELMKQQQNSETYLTIE